ncbi:hypothetical protein Acy02nite_22130 [Actinoplanes cyaneus]|uniref:Uncharacterized protein n=1 Tax=Actinoplanes cyaneus TaxID=52696 RepID=A0A919IF91_9ACTN|nr:hypothetical protein [Actinoplanes cyaneus]MCW2136522.1 hypothetical protein [Actinoplanes cyaneus]GID64332.1 hypothetical protein Acy02nite_22130 [Actinoplanes cyaneus]
MFRYYISFSHQSPVNGFGIGAADFTFDGPISSADDVAAIRADLARQGYSNVAILGFSRYTAKPNPQRNSADTRAPRGR